MDIWKIIYLNFAGKLRSFIYSFTSFTFYGYMVEFAEHKAFPRWAYYVCRENSVSCSVIFGFHPRDFCLDNGCYPPCWCPNKRAQRSQWEQWKRKLKSVVCVVLCCGSRRDWDKLIGLYRIPSVVFATRKIWGRTDYRAERKIKK